MIGIVVGTRPELIKIFPLIRKFKEKKINFRIIHTGQHYSKNLNNVFLKKSENLKIHYNLNVGSSSQAKQTAMIMERLEKLIKNKRFDSIIVYGDTNTALAGALVASKFKNIKLIHIEAGLRSGEIKMPEETNRKIIDHISDYLFAPTNVSYQFLIDENIAKNKIFLTGNLISDSLRLLTKRFKKNEFFKKLNLKINEFILCTIHREENIDNITRLKKILISLGKICSKFNKKIIFPCHPRTLKMIKTKKINLDSNIILVDPLPYNEFLNLLYYSYIVISDSGGVQEECCLLKKRLITIRTKTERQETLKIGCNKLSNVDSKEIIKKIKQLQNSKIRWINPYGKNVSDKIIKILKKI